MLKSLTNISWKLITALSAAFSVCGLLLILMDSTKFDVLAPLTVATGFLLSLFGIYRLHKEAEISENVSIEIAKELFWQANHDSETGILNQKAMRREIEKFHIESKEEEFEHGVLRVDVDNFIVIKKSLGSEAVLSLKKQVACILAMLVEPPKIMAIAGERGFSIFIPNTTHTEIRDFIASIHSEINKEFFGWQNKQLPVGVSIGWTTIDQESESPVNSLNLAEVACIRASQNMTGATEQYTPPKTRDLNELGLIAQINDALKNNKFVLYHQRLFFLGDTEGSGVKYHKSISEVLIRMQVEESDLPMSPGLFLPVAEKFNLMGAIDKWVIKKTFEFISLHNKEENAQKHVYAINLSGASLNDELIFDFISNALTEYNINPQQICFEVTESVAIKNLHHAAYLIGFLKRLGCYVALDDFGTGVSSFEYLKHLPIDKLKLDGSFVKHIADNEIDYGIVSAISNICKTLDIELVAEFVENKETLVKLRELDIKYAQGYLLHKPSPLDGIGVFKEDINASAILKER